MTLDKKHEITTLRLWSLSCSNDAINKVKASVAFIEIKTSVSILRKKNEGVVAGQISK